MDVLLNALILFLCREGADLVVSSLAFGDNGTAWVVDVVGRVWFTTGVLWDNPCGTGKWWQVRSYFIHILKFLY